MNRRSGLSVCAKAGLAAFLAAFVCALVAVVVQRLSLDAAAQDQFIQQVTQWARLGAAQLAEADDPPVPSPGTAPSHSTAGARRVEQFRRWSWAALDHPAGLAAFLVNQKGEVLAQAPQAVGVSGIDFNHLPESATRATIRIAGVERDAWIVAEPVRRSHVDGALGHVILVASAAPAAHVRLLGLSALAVGGTALLTAGALAVWVWQSVGRPLSDLALTESPRTVGWASRSDEWGAIARRFLDLAERVQRAETRADALERGMHARVADRTRRIEGMLAHARKEAWLDSLTRLYNRRFLDEQFDLIVREQQTAGEDLTVIVLDIDHFKAVNDTLGHHAGDNLLVFAGELLRASLRSSDLAVRCGGDEFVIVMLGASRPEGAALAERIIRLFAQQAATLKVGRLVSMSGGVASLRESGVRSGPDLLRAADSALYSAKRHGKDSVESARAR